MYTGMASAGAVAATHPAASQACWALDMELCPLQALLACDITAPVGADCTATTDDTTTNWIWAAELFTDVNDIDVMFGTGGQARIFAHTGNNATNEADWTPRSQVFISHCCTTRR